MILFALVIVAVIFFISCNLFVSNKAVHRTLTILSSAILLITIGFSIANFHDHFGMHLVNKTQTERLAPMTKQQPMLVYEKLGSSQKHAIVVYKHSADGKQLHTKADTSVKNRFVKTKGAKAYLKVTHRKYAYKSGMQKAWFGLAQKGRTKSTVNTFYVPKDWVVLSANQAKVLKKTAKAEVKAEQDKMKTPQAQMALKQKAQPIIQAQVMSAMRANPQMTPVQQKQITDKAQAKFKAQLKQQTLKQVMAKAIAKAKASPVGYMTK